LWIEAWTEANFCRVFTSLNFAIAPIVTRHKYPVLGVTVDSMKLKEMAPSIPYKDFIETETRFSMLWHTHPEDAERFLAQAQQEVNHRYHYYKQLSELDWNDPASAAAVKAQLKTQQTES